MSLRATLDPTDPGLPGTIYGRDAERAALHRALDDVIAGRGRLVLIGGEAGIGKTALIEDLIQQASAHQALVLIGHSDDVLELSSYTPWIEILQQYHPEEDFPEVPAGLRPTVDLNDVRSQPMLFEKARDFFRAVAALRPLVLVLEDAHWADLASLEALRYLARWLAGERVLFVLTYRDDEAQRERPFFRTAPDLVRSLHPLRIDLRPLDLPAMGQLIEDRYQLESGDHARLRTFLADYSDGNPFYMLELIRSLESNRTLVRGEAGWRLGDVSSFHMPSMLRQTMSNRLAGQDAEARAWLEIAAVIGMEVPFDLWATICEAESEQLAEAFAQARDRALVREVPGSASFKFSHALLRAALYERVPLFQRKLWHARAGDELAGSPQPPADLIAHHFRLAGDHRAVDWLIRAGEEAQSGYAWQAAIDRYSEAVAALSDAPSRTNDIGWLVYRIGSLARYGPPEESLPWLERAERLGMETGDRTLVAYSRFKQCVIRSFSAETQRALDELRRAVDDLSSLTTSDFENAGPLRTSLADEPMSESLPDPAINLGLGTLALRLASSGRHSEAERAALEFLRSVSNEPRYGNPALVPYADAYTALAFVYTVRGRPDEARDALHRARDAYRRGDDRRGEALGYFAELTLIVNTYEHQRKAERRALAERAASAMQRAQGAFPSELPPELFAFENFWIEGDWDRAVIYARSAQWHMGPDIILAEIALCRGEADEVRRLVQQALPDGHRTHPGRPSFLVRFNLIHIAARLCLAAGSLEEASLWIECFARWIEWSEMTFGMADLALLRAEYLAACHELDQARAQAEAALELARNPRQALVLMPAHRLRAKLDLATGDLDSAGRHIARAIEIAREAGMAFEQALGWLTQSEHASAIGDANLASRLLNSATDVFRRLNAAPFLDQANALRVLVQRTGETDYPGGLSAREVEVLRLVAEGLTDAEVADRLFISRRTVSQHLRSIYAKLGIGSRVAAARFALDHDLV